LGAFKKLFRRKGGYKMTKLESVKDVLKTIDYLKGAIRLYLGGVYDE
jgi:hypothetical protein